MTVTFDPITSIYVTLSDGDLTLTSPGYLQGARSTVSHASGKWYFEVTLTTINAYWNEGWGVCIPTATFSELGDMYGVNGIVCFANGDVAADGNNATGDGLFYSYPGDVVGVAVDIDNKKIWCWPSAGSNVGTGWDGSGTANPVTNTGGNSWTVDGAVEPFFMFGTDREAPTITINFGATAFVAAPPSGFNAWSATATFDSSTGVILSNGDLTIFNIVAAMYRGQGAMIPVAAGQSSGKYYFELAAVNFNPDNEYWGDSTFGVCLTSADYTNLSYNNGTGGTAYYIGWGSVYLDGSYEGGVGNGLNAVGDIIGVAVDLDNRSIWFKPVFGSDLGMDWNDDSSADPATNTGGVTVLDGVVVPFVAYSQADTNDAISANFGATAFVGTVPSGFTTWPEASTETGPPLEVTIGGLHFTGADVVTFGGVSTDFTFIDDTHITATVPHGSGTVDVRVHTPVGISALNPPADQFTYDVISALVNPPVVTYVDPAYDGRVGVPTIVSGQYFTGATDVEFVGIDSQSSATFTFIDDGTLLVDVPEWPGGTQEWVDIRVTTPLGTSAVSDADQYWYLLYRWPEDVIGWRATVTSNRIWGVSSYDESRWGSSYLVAYNDRVSPSRVVAPPQAIELSDADPAGLNWGNAAEPGQFLQDANYVYIICGDSALVSRIPHTGTFDDIEHLVIPQGCYPLGSTYRSFTGGVGSDGNWNCCIHGTKMYIPWPGKWNGTSPQMLLLVIDLAAWNATTGWAVYQYSTDTTNYPGAWSVCVTDNGTIVLGCQTLASYPATPGGRICYSNVSNPTSWNFINITYAPAFAVSTGNKVYFLEASLGGSNIYAASRGTHLIIADCTSGTPVMSYVAMTDDPNFVGIAQYSQNDTVFPCISGSYLFFRANATVRDDWNHNVTNTEFPYLARRNLSDGSAAGGAFMSALVPPWTWELWNNSLESYGGNLYSIDISLAYGQRYFVFPEAMTSSTFYPVPVRSAPPNELFANAITLTVGNNYLGNSYYATFEAGEQTPIQWFKTNAMSWQAKFREEHTVWFKFTAPADGAYPISYGCQGNVTQGLPYTNYADGVQVSVWWGSSSIGSQVCMAEHQATFYSAYNTDWFVSTILYAASGVTYWIRLSQWVDRETYLNPGNISSLPTIAAEDGSNFAIMVGSPKVVRQTMIYNPAFSGITHCMVPWGPMPGYNTVQSPYMTHNAGGTFAAEV